MRVSETGTDRVRDAGEEWRTVRLPERGGAYAGEQLAQHSMHVATRRLRPLQRRRGRPHVRIGARGGCLVALELGDALGVGCLNRVR